MMDTLILPVLYSFLALFVIVDPFLGLAVFMSITKGMNRKEKFKQATIATGVALVLLLLFLFTGLIILGWLGITFGSFMVGGGIILLIMGVQAVLGIEFAKKGSKIKAAAVVIGTPLLTGPGAMTAVVILSNKYGYLPPAIGAVLVMIITFFMLAYSDKLHKLIGDRVVEVFSRVLGLLLVAIAVEIIKNGITEMIHGFKFN